MAEKVQRIAETARSRSEVERRLQQLGIDPCKAEISNLGGQFSIQFPSGSTV